MKIAVIGSGRIGGTLAKKWVVDGHSVTFGSRDPQKAELQQLVCALGKDATAATIPAAIAGAQVVVFAIPASAMDETVFGNARALEGKLVVDATNVFGGLVANSLALFQERTPSVKYYRAFNGYGWENFEDPVFGGVSADLFYCGPDGPDKAVIEELITAVGLHPIYVSGSEEAYVLDGVLTLWATLVRGQKFPRTLAFKVLVR
jgi:predicted dinucleotide-binding enzyme